VPPLGLRVRALLHLQPAGPVVLVDAELSLRHNPLKIAGVNLREKGLAMLHDMLRIKQPWTLRGPDDLRESLLSLDKGPPPQVLAIKPQKVECVQHGLPFAAEKLVELAHALRIDANNLAVKDGVLDGQLRERPLEGFESKVPLIARNELRLAVPRLEGPRIGPRPVAQRANVTFVTYISRQTVYNGASAIIAAGAIYPRRLQC